MTPIHKLLKQPNALPSAPKVVRKLIELDPAKPARPRQYWRALPREAPPIFGDISFGQR